MLKWTVGITALVLAWSAIALAGALQGWWMEPLAPAGDRAAFAEALDARVAQRRAGAVAVLLVEDGAVVHQVFAGSGSADPAAGAEPPAVDADTVFPTASLSKWITAHAVMALVEDGRVDLDQPVATYLSRWSLPDAGFDNDAVTVRRLLSHTAGLTDGLGFGDYRRGEAVPPIDAELRAPRASGGQPAAIAVGVEPGSEWRYSGGGYAILQLLVEEVAGQPFADFVAARVFTPLSMQRATFAAIDTVPGHVPNTAPDGSPAPAFRYAVAGATGLQASARDLAQLAIAQFAGGPPGWLQPATLAAMREPHGRQFGFDIWGLGTILYAPTGAAAGPDAFVFGHDGANDPAINSAVRVHPGRRAAIVALANGDPGLATRLGSAWVLWQTGVPDALDTGVALRSARVPWLVGSALIIATGMTLAWRRRVRLAGGTKG